MPNGYRVGRFRLCLLDGIGASWRGCDGMERDGEERYEVEVSQPERESMESLEGFLERLRTGDPLQAWELDAAGSCCEQIGRIVDRALYRMRRGG